MTVDQEATDLAEEAAHLSGSLAAETANEEQRSSKGWARFVGPAATFAAFIGFWYLTHYVLMSENRKFLVPPPHEVIEQSLLTWNIERGENNVSTGGGLQKLLESDLLDAAQTSRLERSVAPWDRAFL